MGFEQAAIPVEHEQEFSKLRGAIRNALASERVERFFAVLKRKGVRIRDFDSVVAERVLESVDSELKKAASAQALYEALSTSDKGQIREFYLGLVEQVPGELRHKFHQVFRDF